MLYYIFMQITTPQMGTEIALQGVEHFDIRELANVAAAVSAGELMVAQLFLPLDAGTSVRQISSELDARINSAGLKRGLFGNSFKGTCGDVKPMHSDDMSVQGIVNAHYTKTLKSQDLSTYEAVFLEGPVIDDKTTLTGKIRNEIFTHSRTTVTLPPDIAQLTKNAWHADGESGTLLLFGNLAHQFKTTSKCRESWAMYYAPYDFLKGQFELIYP